MPEKEYEFGSATKSKAGAPGGRPPGGEMTGEKANDAGRAIKELLGYIRRYVPVMVIALLLGAVSAVISVIGPDKISDITNLITDGLLGTIDIGAIVKICVMLAGLYVLSWVFGYVQSFILATVTQRVSKSLRTDISEKINRMPLTYFDRHSFGDVLSRVTNDVDTIGQMMNNSIGNLISAVTLLFGSLIMMFITNAAMAVSAVVASLLGFGFIMVIMAHSQKYFLAQQNTLGVINGQIEEIYAGHQVVKAYNGEKEAETIFDNINEKLYGSAWKSQFFSGLMMPLMGFIGNLGYEEERIIIHDFSAKAKAGQMVAIVGPTGAGKTTIVNLLMRFYETNSGEIRIDGVPIKELKRENVRDQFCMVLQDTWIFEGTLRENIVYSKQGVTDAELDRVCEAVGLTHYVKSLPQGYDTLLNEQTSMSAGQRQLITIARAMIENAPLLILDEATSSVDTKTELLVQEAMARLTEGRTSFVIAHRLSTIKNADLILVMKDGDIIESGNHEELLRRGGFYADLYNSQFEQNM